MSIQEISNLLGYADISHFSRAFKKWTNITPSNYRMPKIKKIDYLTNVIIIAYNVYYVK